MYGRTTSNCAGVQSVPPHSLRTPLGVGQTPNPQLLFEIHLNTIMDYTIDMSVRNYGNSGYLSPVPTGTRPTNQDQRPKRDN